MLRILVVDDSSFARRRIRQVLAQAQDIVVVGEAGDGREAVEMAARLQPDLITMDYEMPVMDGVSALQRIRQQRPVPVIMISSLTFAGARVTLMALEAGASDFVVKSQIDATAQGRVSLIDKIRALCAAPSPSPHVPSPHAPPPPVAPAPVASPSAAQAAWQPRLVIIGASTGGPPTVRQVLAPLGKDFPLPILVVQHMPERFTRAFAERLQESGPLPAQEAVDQQVMKAGQVYVAPGGRQLLLESEQVLRMRVVQEPTAQLYHPSLDLTLGSAAKMVGAKVLVLVLTGMGDDGVRGGRLLRRAGGRVWAQQADTCVVNGMPQAMRDAGLVDAVLPPVMMGQRLARQAW